jgi:hypothetical protein
MTSINKDNLEIEQEDYMEELIDSNFIEYDSEKKQIWWQKMLHMLLKNIMLTQKKLN